jgi:hypothetical protein
MTMAASHMAFAPPDSQSLPSRLTPAATPSTSATSVPSEIPAVARVLIASEGDGLHDCSRKAALAFLAADNEGADAAT